MNGLFRPLLLLLCALFMVIAGCTSPSINGARYGNGGIFVDLTTGSSGTDDARVQVTIYRIKDLHQSEYLVVDTPVALTNTGGEVFLPAPLEPGSYKLYIYLIRNGQRTNAVIRDIVV
jgi:hypothetical protein